MLKKIIVAMLAAQMLVQPVQANELPEMTPKQKQEFCKAIIGIDDALLVAAVTFMITHLGITYLQNWGRGREIKKLKAESAKRCST